MRNILAHHKAYCRSKEPTSLLDAVRKGLIRGVFATLCAALILISHDFIPLAASHLRLHGMV